MKDHYEVGERVEIVAVPEFVDKNKIGKKGTVSRNDKRKALPLLVKIDFSGWSYFFDYEHVKPIV